MYVFSITYRCNCVSLFTSGTKKKKKHKKKSKRRRESVSSKSSDSGQTKIKLAKFDDDDNFGILKNDESKLFDIMSKQESMNDMTKFEDQLSINKDSNIIDKIMDGSASPLLPPISKKTDDEFDEPIIPKVLGLYFNLLVFVVSTIDIIYKN